MLSQRELERAARVIDEQLRDARVERIVQADAERLYLVLYAGPDSGKRCLLLSCRPQFARVAEVPRPAKAPETLPPFAGFLRKRLHGARLRGAALRGGDRQLALRLETREGRYELLLSILGKRSNCYLLDADGAVLRSQRPLPATRPELALGQPWQDPQSAPPHEGEDRFADVEDGDLLAAIEARIGEDESDQDDAGLRRRVEVALRKEGANARRRREKVEAELAEADEATELQRRGDLLKTVLGRVESGASSIDVEDPVAAETVTIPLDPALTPKQNLEATFKRYQKMLRRLTKAGGQVDEARSRCDEVERFAAELAEIPESDAAAIAELAEREPLARWLTRHAPAVKRKGPAPTRSQPARIGRFKDVPRRLHPRRYRSLDGMEIWVGRNDDGNDFLSTRLARGKDLFFHLDGAPGSHVVLRTEGRPDPPSESLLDACELAVHFSKAKRATRADVHIVPIKNVKKPKGAKPGLVMVSGGRSLHLRREESRLKRLLGARIDED